MSNLIGTTVMCPECGGWNVPGHSCRDKNPFQDIANALAREVRETDALKTRLVDASKRIKELEDAKRVWQESAERMLDNATRYRGALEQFAAYDPDCTCGMCVPCISRKTLKHE